MRNIIIAASLATLILTTLVVAITKRSSDPIHHLARDPAGPTLAQTLRIVSSEHLTRVHTSDLLRGAINGMLATLNDPYTSYSTPNETARAADLTSLSYEGIGISVAPSDRQNGRGAMILGVTPGGPADHAGLHPGDAITHVDDHDVTTISITDITHRIRGAAGTPTTLTIARPIEPTPLRITITRQALVTTPLQAHHHDDTTIIRISSFTEGLTDQLRYTLDRLPPTTTHLVLDLRDNPGGLLTEAINVVDAFLATGDIVLERARGTVRTLASARSAGTVELPLVVLVNRFSASSAEVVAAALQAHQRALIVGETTYGKGVAQSTAQLADGGTLTYTILEWLPPGGEPLHGLGVTPDVVVMDTRYPATVLSLTGSTAVPGSTLTLLLDGELVGTATATEDGSIRFTAARSGDVEADAILEAALALRAVASD